MLYLLDIHHKPPMVVLATEDEDQVREVGQTYANQVSRPLVVATGPAPDNAHFKPIIPGLEPPPAPLGKDARLFVEVEPLDPPTHRKPER